MYEDDVTITVADEGDCHDQIYSRLLHLSGSPRPLGAIRISRAVLIWRNHFRWHPLHEQAMNMLTRRGSEEEFWLLSTEVMHYRPSQPTSQETEPSRNPFDQFKRDFSDVFTNGALSDHEVRPGERRISRVESNGKADLTFLAETISALKDRCRGIEEVLRRSSIYNLSYSHKISRLISQIQYQIEILEICEFALKELSVIQRFVRDFLEAGDRLEILLGQTL